MMEMIAKHLQGWSIPTPDLEQLSLMVHNAIEFIEQHNKHYQDTIASDDAYVVALSVAYRLWSIRATTASSSRGGISMSSASSLLMDLQLEGEYKQVFAKRFSTQVLSVI